MDGPAKTSSQTLREPSNVGTRAGPRRRGRLLASGCKTLAKTLHLPSRTAAIAAKAAPKDDFNRCARPRKPCTNAALAASAAPQPQLPQAAAHALTLHAVDEDAELCVAWMSTSRRASMAKCRARSAAHAPGPGRRGGPGIGSDGKGRLIDRAYAGRARAKTSPALAPVAL